MILCYYSPNALVRLSSKFATGFPLYDGLTAADYFYMNNAPPSTYWAALADQPDFEVLSVADVIDDKQLPDHVRSIGKQNRMAYEELVGKSKVLLGIGFPAISPSVYSAL